MDKRYYLTEAERTTLLNALNTAAEKYQENAKFLRSEFPRGQASTAEQLDRQAKEVTELVKRIEGAEFVWVWPVEDGERPST
jgi:hypothetical protein